MTRHNILNSYPLQRFVRAVYHFRSDRARRRKARSTYAQIHSELSAMSTRELTDIGLDRADIPTIAARGASRQFA